MADEEIRVGDTVRLKSGGPLMTVAFIGVSPGGNRVKKARCYWFVEGDLREESFEIEALVKSSEAPNPGVHVSKGKLE